MRGTTQMTVDTLTITRQLVDAGFDRPQAEAVADVLRDTSSENATQSDLGQAIASLATRSDVSELKADLYRALWLQTGAIVAAVAGLLAIVARLPSS